MKFYELTYLISPDLSEEELRNLSNKVIGFIQEETGKIEKTTGPSGKKLGYPIKKKGRASLVTLNFSLSPEKLGSLEKKLKSENQILRYTILTKKVKEKIPTKRALPRVKKPLEVTKRITKPKKVELKEIDKKIEEILQE